MGFKSDIYVFCPLRNKDIDEYECGDICLVVEDVSPDDELPLGMTLNEEDKSVCLKCKNHLPD